MEKFVPDIALVPMTRVVVLLLIIIFHNEATVILVLWLDVLI